MPEQAPSVMVTALLLCSNLINPPEPQNSQSNKNLNAMLNYTTWKKYACQQCTSRPYLNANESRPTCTDAAVSLLAPSLGVRGERRQASRAYLQILAGVWPPSCWVSDGRKNDNLKGGVSHHLRPDISRPALICAHHSSLPQKPEAENYHKANLLPVRTLPAALQNSSQAHLYPYNELQSTELPREKETVVLNRKRTHHHRLGWGGGGGTRRAGVTKAQTHYPCQGHIYFSTTKHTNMQQGHHNSIKTNRLRSPL